MMENIKCNFCNKIGVTTKLCCGNNKEIRIQQIKKEINNLTDILYSYQNELKMLLSEDNSNLFDEKNI